MTIIMAVRSSYLTMVENRLHEAYWHVIGPLLHPILAVLLAPPQRNVKLSRVKQFLSQTACASHMTPRKYVFDVTYVGQRSSPWTYNSVKVERKFHLECKLHFPSAQFMLRQMHLTNVSESIKAIKY